VRTNVYEFLNRVKSHSVEEHLRYWLPGLHKVLRPFFNSTQRISIYRNIESNLNSFQWFYWVITGYHISKKGFSLSNYGVWLAFRPNDITYHLCLDASYRNNLEKILNKVSEDTIFLDIGANIGVFSLVADQNPKITKIHSFEPDSESFKFLGLNISRNNATKVMPHNFAIGEHAGSARLTRNEGHSGASRIESENIGTSGQFSSITMVNHNYLNSTLDSRAEKYFVKIDVEGYEFEVLTTLHNAEFFKSIKKFFIEFDLEIGEVEKVEKFLVLNDFVESGRWGSKSHWDALWERRY
jgi:FkbM family methyltransferase